MIWDPDVPLTLEIASQLVKTQFPQHTSLQPFGQGWDNQVFLSGQGTLFRFPHRKLAGELIQSEIAVLPTLCNLLPLPIPEITYVGQPAENYPYQFIGYPLIPGQTTDSLDWQTETRASKAVQLGQFLNVLHSLDLAQPPFNKLPDDTIFRKDPTRHLETITARANQIDNLTRLIDLPKLLTWSFKTANSVAPTTKTAVVHGDLYPRHLLGSPKGQITGVIDWGDIHRGHPALDLSLAYTFLPPVSHHDFLTAYNLPVEPEDLKLAQLRAAMYGTALAYYGQEIQDANAHRMGIQILQNLPYD